MTTVQIRVMFVPLANKLYDENISVNNLLICVNSLTITFCVPLVTHKVIPGRSARKLTWLLQSTGHLVFLEAEMLSLTIVSVLK